MYNFRNFANDFELKPFGWYDLPCDSEGFYFYKGWYVNTKALCERDVEGKPSLTSDEQEKIFGPDGCLPGLLYNFCCNFYKIFS